ncbi:50S ribosomal protein L29 [Candidatus Mikella endobia]|uniref:Large ribosomal subunit protein uL29 n=1 Tax=Candidatus Mikella endobia TaxID=1778264 RepID=A0A143WPS1_9ENTR|nr:50S ribosomal protein L29 [Candidatus Mikella endobia]CUX95728.1 50S ribosomal protein L29 [Candidatus Mikella endobia]
MMNIHKENIQTLNKKLSSLFREQFYLRMQASNGKLHKYHLFKKVRYNIARIKTLLTEITKIKGT